MTSFASPRALLKLALMVGIIACSPMGLGCPPPLPCSHELTFSQDFHFESDCTDALCGFVAVTGGVSNVGTLHPGEHGMQLTGGATARVAFTAPLIPRSSEELHLVARCDSGTTLSATEEFTIAGAAHTASGAVVATTHWDSYDVSFFTSGTEPAGVVFQPTALSFTVTGPGACIVDEITYATYASRCNFNEDAGMDVPRDARRDGASDGFGDAAIIRSGCTTDAQCGTGFQCLTAFPGGLCTRHCTNNGQCGIDALCEPQNGICLPSCTSGGLECNRVGGMCSLLNSGGERVCLPACFPSGTVGAPPGYPMCPAAIGCYPFSGSCGTSPGVGDDDGSPCTMDSDCRGNRCVTEIDPRTGMSSGFIGGYCLSFGRVPSLASFMVGAPVPQGSCPPGTGIIPLNGELEGDQGTCLRTCNSAADCRVGYECDHLLSGMGGGPFFSNGVCLPVDCNVSGMNCPSGYACVVSPSDAALSPGVCTAAGDAGTDAGTDAAVDASVGD